MPRTASERKLSDCLEALSNPYRRRLLLSLLTDAPRGKPLNLLGDIDKPDDIRTRLTHSHLPKLEAMGFIERHRTADEISTGPHWDEIAPLLRLIDDNRSELPPV